MSMNIPPDFLDTLRTRVDLPSLAKAEGLDMQKAGKLWKACCPFHAERTPSFVISERHGEWRWHCYGGCGGGDAIDLVMRRSGLSFNEAVERVARHCGMQVEKHDINPKAAQKREEAKARRVSIFELLALASDWYAQNLWGPEGEEARAELARRGFSEEQAREWHLGFAPKKGGLLKEFQRQKANTDLTVTAGLFGKREDGSGLYERFRSRLMFPIRDRQGRVVGFSGRHLGEEDDKIAKYTNTPEIEGVFTKGRLLFGLDTAWKAIGQAGRVVVVEGHVDCLALQARGMGETVALMGTAFTEDHLRILEGLEAEVVLLMDGDEAGRKATWKIIPMLAGAGIPAKAALLPFTPDRKEDPDSFIRKQGVDELRTLLKDAPDAFAAWLEHLAEGASPMKLAGIFQDDVAPVLAEMTEAALDLYSLALRKVFGLKMGTIKAAVEALRTGKKEKAPPPPSPKAAPEVMGESKGGEIQIGDIIRSGNGNMYVVVRSKGGDMEPHKVMTGHIVPLKRIRLGEDGEVLIADLVCPKRKITTRVHLPSSVWSSKRAFKEALPTLDFGWYGTDDELVTTMLALGREDVPIVKGTRVLGIHRLGDQWAFVATDKTYLPGGKETADLIHYADGETGVVYDSGQVSAPVKEDFQLFRVYSLDFSSEPKAASIMGWIGAVPFKERLSHILRDRRFPFLCVWGERGAAKSVYLEQLAMEFLGAGQTAPSMLNQLKPFSAMLTASLSNVVPFGVDEHKGDTHMMREQALVLSETIRNTYQGGVGKRGRKDGRTQRNYTATAPLVVAGEDSVGEPAAQERMIEVFLAKRDQVGRLSSWQSLRRCNLPGLGLDYIRWSLDVPDSEIEAEFKEVCESLRPEFRDRIRHNVAVAVLGLRMICRWLKERGYPWMDAWLPQFSKALEEEQFKARYPSAAGKNKSIVDNTLELMSAAAANHILKDGQDYTFKDDGTRLCISLQKAYPLMREWAARTRYDQEVLSLDAFRKQLEQEPYFVTKNLNVRFRRAYNESATVKTVVLDYSRMISLGLEVEGFREEDMGVLGEPGPEERKATPSQGRLEVGHA